MQPDIAEAGLMSVPKHVLYRCPPRFYPRCRKHVLLTLKAKVRAKQYTTVHWRKDLLVHQKHEKWVLQSKELKYVNVI